MVRPVLSFNAANKEVERRIMEKKQKRWKILVVWKNGDEEFVANGTDDAIFTSKEKAQEVADGFKMGIDDAESVSVVRA